jgi:hypothetical protein
MSAWRRSTSSTRRTQDRFGAWYMKPVVAAAVAVAEAAAVAAEAAASVVAAGAALALAAEAAEEAVLAAEGAEEAAEAAAGLAGESALDLPAEAAARPGEVAAGARPNLLLALKNAGHHGRVRRGRPGQLISSLQCCPRTQAGSP